MTTLTIQGEKEDMTLIRDLSANNAEIAHMLVQPLIVMGKSAQGVTEWLRESRIAQEEAARFGDTMGRDLNETRDLDTICTDTLELQALIDAVGHAESRACVLSAFRSAFRSARNEARS